MKTKNKKASGDKAVIITNLMSILNKKEKLAISDNLHFKEISKSHSKHIIPFFQFIDFLPHYPIYQLYSKQPTQKTSRQAALLSIRKAEPGDILREGRTVWRKKEADLEPPIAYSKWGRSSWSQWTEAQGRHYLIIWFQSFLHLIVNDPSSKFMHKRR